MRVRAFALLLGAMMALVACGGDATEDEPAPVESEASTASSEAPVESSEAETTSTTAAAVAAEPDGGPIDFAIDGTCRINVHREDENGTTWLMICNLAHGASDAPNMLRSTEHSGYFQNVVDPETDERVGVVLQQPLIQGRNCMWTHTAFEVVQLDIVDDVVTYDGNLRGGFGCEEMTLDYAFTWNVVTDEATMTGTLDPGA